MSSRSTECRRTSSSVQPRRSRRLMIGVSAVVVAATLNSCGGSAGDALLIGRLYGDAGIGCVWIGRPSEGAEIDWPGSVSVEFDPIRVSGRGFVAREGDWFRLAGGTDSGVPVTSGCPVAEPELGRFVPDSVEYFGDRRPSAELNPTSETLDTGPS